jgi:hypothetical protein
LYRGFLLLDKLAGASLQILLVLFLALLPITTNTTKLTVFGIRLLLIPTVLRAILFFDPFVPLFAGVLLVNRILALLIAYFLLDTSAPKATRLAEYTGYQRLFARTSFER